jgi:nucleotide-binding universal stress UspA family protein
MKMLLAIDEHSDPRTTSAYLAERFGHCEVEIEILTVVAEPALHTDSADPEQVVSHNLLRERARRDAVALVSTVATELRERHALAEVRTHVEFGDPARSILAASERLQADLLLLESRQPSSMLSRLRLTSVTRRVLAAAPCSVELIKPYGAVPRSLFNVLVPVATTDPARFPMTFLTQLPWQQGTRIQLLALLPPAHEEGRLEQSAPRVLHTMQEARAARSRAEVVLREIRSALEDEFGTGIEIVYEATEANGRNGIIDAATRLRASLIVMSAEPTGSIAGLLAGNTAMRVALRAPCSVLVARTPSKDVRASSKSASKQRITGARNAYHPI